MRILSVTAQKPCSTGSGVYLTEVVKALAKEGHTQTVLAGIARGEQMDMPDGVKAYPVYFESEGLPYPVVGMSDEMPYISTRYKDMTEEMTVQFRNAFLAVLDEVIEREDPELIGRQALHAGSLSFFQPVSGQPVKCEAGLPEDMRRAVEILREKSRT